MHGHASVNYIGTDIITAGKSHAPGGVFSTAAAVKLPSLRGIPCFIYPDTVNFPPQAIQRLAQLLLQIDPACAAHAVPAGCEINIMAAGLVQDINKAMESYAARHGLRQAFFECAILEDCALSVKVCAFEGDVMPIFYTEALRWVKRRAPRMVSLFDDAIKFLGSVMYTWEDARREAKDYYEEIVIPELQDDPEGNKDEITSYKEMLNSMEKVCPVKTFFKRGMSYKDKGLPSFEKKVSGVRALCKKEILLVEWLKNVAEIIRSKNRLVNMEDDDGDYRIPYQKTLPLLWSRDDAISEKYFFDINEEFDSGAYIGLHFEHKIPLLDDNSAPQDKELCHILDNIDLLGKIQHVYSL